jgi:hypothetical protein
VFHIQSQNFIDCQELLPLSSKAFFIVCSYETLGTFVAAHSPHEICAAEASTGFWSESRSLCELELPAPHHNVGDDGGSEKRRGSRWRRPRYLGSLPAGVADPCVDDHHDLGIATARLGGLRKGRGLYGPLLGGWITDAGFARTGLRHVQRSSPDIGMRVLPETSRLIRKPRIQRYEGSAEK